MTDWGGLAVVFLVAVNPLRVRFGVPGPRPAVRVRVSIIGAAVSAAAVVAFASSATPLLDAWDASAPTLRIGTGALVFFGGVRDLLARVPEPEPALGGWRAGLVPVALPLLVGPGFLAVSLSAGADRGIAMASAAAAPALALVVIAALLPGDPVDATLGGRLHRWGARFTGGLALLLGVLLAADGVFDV